MKIENLYALFSESSGISTDSREDLEGTIFFALQGQNFDGNLYAAAALGKGAMAAVVDNEEVVVDDRYILVEDTLKTLQDLAKHHRAKFSIPVLAITGSNGKTTTKELITGVLQRHYHCHATIGNLNNHIGVPLTLLGMPLQTQIAVIEMGANHQGEIRNLCQIAMPTHGVITNVGKAHLEGFGGFEGVKKGKGELYGYLAQHNGTAFINQDERHLEEMARHVRSKVFYYRSEQGGAYGITLLRESPALELTFSDESGESLRVVSRLFGIYNFHNIMTAIAIGKFFQVPAQKIKEAIADYVPSNNRSQRLEWKGAKIILDAYNANPSSVRNALFYLSSLPANRKVAVLGDMFELGPDSEEEHLNIVAYAVEKGIQEIVLVGKAFRKAAQQFNLTHLEDVNQLKNWWKNRQFQDETILIKGSRAMALEKIFENI